MALSKSKIHTSLFTPFKRPSGSVPLKTKYRRYDKKLIYDKPAIGELFAVTPDNIDFGKNIFDTIRTLAEKDDISPADHGALNWYFSTVYKFYTYTNFLRDKEIHSSGRLKSYVPEPFEGKMLIFKYKPKDTRQVFDQYPLVITTKRLHDGFIGCNLHYLPFHIRTIVFDYLLMSISSHDLTKGTTRFRINDKLLKRRPKLYDWLEPCIRRYKYSRVKSRLLLVPPMDWGTGLFLPFDRFMNASRMSVQRQTILASNSESYGIK